MCQPNIGEAVNQLGTEEKPKACKTRKVRKCVQCVQLDATTQKTHKQDQRSKAPLRYMTVINHCN